MVTVQAIHFFIPLIRLSNKTKNIITLLCKIITVTNFCLNLVCFEETPKNDDCTVWHAAQRSDSLLFFFNFIFRKKIVSDSSGSHCIFISQNKSYERLTCSPGVSLLKMLVSQIISH